MPRHSRGPFFEDYPPYVDNSGPHGQHVKVSRETPPARFRIHKRKGQLKRAKSTPWHLRDRATGKEWLVSDWRGALELAEAVTR